MSKEKQIIEEMADVYYKARLKARDTLGSMNEGEEMWYSKAFFEAGYRKTSDVAREIFEEIEKWLPIIDYPIIAELKKKYTEDGK